MKRQEAAAGEAARAGAGTVSLAAVKDVRTWHLSAISLLANIPKWGIVFFCPLIIDYILGEHVRPGLALRFSSLSSGAATQMLYTAMPDLSSW